MVVQEGFLNKHLKAIPSFWQKTIKNRGVFVYKNPFHTILTKFGSEIALRVPYNTV